jgi:hypothetical protein
LFYNCFKLGRARRGYERTEYLGAESRGIGEKKLCASAQGTPRASAGNQMSRTQMRAKSGAASVIKTGEKLWETLGDPEAAKTQTTVAGTGDKIWSCEAGVATAVSGCEVGAGADLQQAIRPQQPQSFAAGPVAGTEAAATWAQTSNRLQRMVSTNFTVWLSSIRRFGAGRILS